MTNNLNEGKKLDRAKKAVATGMTVANLYTAGDITSRAAQGEGNPRHDIVAAASTLPGAAGWAATAAHYGRKAYEKMQKEDNDPCWKGYRAYGMKKKRGKMVPNCVPVSEDSLDEAKKEKKKPEPIKLTPEQENDPKIPYSVAAYRDRIYKARLKQLAKEDVQLDEISQKTKLSYINKSDKEANPGNKQGSFKSPLSDRKQWNRMAGRIRATDPEQAKNTKLYKYQDDRKKLDEISAELVGKVHNKRLEKGQVPSKTLRNAVRKKWLESQVGKVKKEEVTSMDTHNIISEAFENIFDGNLNSMRDNLFTALEEKTMSALDERKKVIAESYFAQSEDEVEE